MQIFVKLDVGKTITLDVEGTDLISEIRKMVFAKGGLPVFIQRLSYCGKPLEDDRTISDCNIVAETTLYEGVRRERL